jgi:hypothetical protein
VLENIRGAHHSSIGNACEDLVKDALRVLTSSSVSATEGHEREVRPEPVVSSMTQPSGKNSMGALQPSSRQILELWHLFTIRVDPLTKLLHCPTFAPILFAVIDEPKHCARQTLAFSVYFAAISSCSATEAYRRFGKSKDTLLQRYSQVIEAAVAQSYDLPNMELMQALLLYLLCVRRGDHEDGQWPLYSLAVRIAQMMRLHEDPGDRLPPFEVEMRRRMWWTICGLETRRGEEGATKTKSILASSDVRLPANVDDRDLCEAATRPPESRNGIAEMSFVLIRWRVQQLMHRLWNIRQTQERGQQGSSEADVRTEQLKAYNECQNSLHSQFLRYCHDSRPFDQMLLGLVEVMMVRFLCSCYTWSH